MFTLLQKFQKINIYRDESAKILEVRFHNPSLKNALDQQMQGEAYLVQEFIKEQQARAVIFSGEGEVFSAGGDLNFLNHLTTLPLEESQKIMHQFYSAFIALAQTDCPSIALVNGHAVGAGLCFALACDMIFAADHAKIGLNFSALGIPPGMGGEYWAKHKLPVFIAHEMIASAQIKTISAWNLTSQFNFVGPEKAARENAYACALQIAQNSPQANLYATRQLRNFHLSLEQTLDLEAEGQAHCFSKGKVADAIKAFQNKEKFSW